MLKQRRMPLPKRSEKDTLRRMPQLPLQPAVWTWTVSTIINWVVEQAIRSWKVADRVRRLALPSLRYSESDLRDMTFVLLDDDKGEAVATAAWEKSETSGSANESRNVLLHGLYVLPRWQRRGLGSSLLEFVVLWAAINGIDSVNVRAWREAQPFFRRHGFQPLNTQQPLEGHYDVLQKSSRRTH